MIKDEYSQLINNYINNCDDSYGCKARARIGMWFILQNGEYAEFIHLNNETMFYYIMIKSVFDSIIDYKVNGVMMVELPKEEYNVFLEDAKDACGDSFEKDAYHFIHRID